jgi:hypothetical protein
MSDHSHHSSTGHHCDALDRWVADQCKGDQTDEGSFCSALKEFYPLSFSTQCRSRLYPSQFGEVLNADIVSNDAWAWCSRDEVKAAVVADASVPLIGETPGVYPDAPLREPKTCTASDLDEIIADRCDACMPSAHICVNPRADDGMRCSRTVATDAGMTAILGADVMRRFPPHVFSTPYECEEQCKNNWRAVAWPPPALKSWLLGEFGDGSTTADSFAASAAEGQKGDHRRHHHRHHHHHPTPPAPIRHGVGCIDQGGSTPGWTALGPAGQNDNYPCDPNDSGPIDFS